MSDRPAEDGDVNLGCADTGRSYRHWTRTECAELIAGLRAGTTLAALAARHRRRITAVQSRIALMIPASEQVTPDLAEGWLRDRLAHDADYDWLAVLHERGKAPRERVHEDFETGERVAGLWQDIVGVELRPESLQRFLTRPEVSDLALYPDDTLRVAGVRLWQLTGALLLGSWLRECAWPGGGLVDITWPTLASHPTDGEAAVSLRELVSAAVADLGSDRLAHLMTCRLGLDDEGWRTLRATGEVFSLSAERVRQLQEKALARMARTHRPPRVNDHAKRVLTGLLDQAAVAQVDRSQALLVVAEAAMPYTAASLAAQVLSALLGLPATVRRQLSAEVRTAEIARDNARKGEAASEGFVKRANARLDRILAGVEWPRSIQAPPKRGDLLPLREVRGESGGSWYSAKLGREVRYESQAELRMVHTLERAQQIDWYCEQPLAIHYVMGDRRHTYYPDLLAVTTNARCFVVEIKNLVDLPLDLNRAKFQAARRFCHGKGWGFVVTDGSRTAQNIRDRRVNAEVAALLRQEIGKTGTLTWPQLQRLRATAGFTQADLAAVALAYDWELRRRPYRLVAEPAAHRSA